jgi:hypothetical protein
MGELQAYQPLHAKLISFQEDVNKLFRQAVEERRIEIQAKVQKEVTARLYGQSTPLNKFVKLKFTPNNAPILINVYKLMEIYAGVKAEDTEAIEQLGKEKGFTPEESLALYNMQKYAEAIDNIRAQRDDTIRFVVGNA